MSSSRRLRGEKVKQSLKSGGTPTLRSRHPHQWEKAAIFSFCYQQGKSVRTRNPRIPAVIHGPLLSPRNEERKLHLTELISPPRTLSKNQNESKRGFLGS